MRRIQGAPSGPKDPDEEKKKSREAVLSNLLVFTLIVGLIRSAPFIVNNF